MRTFAKSDKLHGVCYDVRGPVLDAANEMKRQGTEILQLNIGNRRRLAFRHLRGFWTPFAMHWMIQ